MTKDIDKLQQSLQSAMLSGLMNGGPLQVEDIEATMECKTFFIPMPMKISVYNRMLLNLRKRNIEFKINEYNSRSWIFLANPSRNATLIIGDRSLLIELIE